MSLCDRCKCDIEGKFKKLVEELATLMKESGASVSVTVTGEDAGEPVGRRYRFDGDDKVSLSLSVEGVPGLDLESALSAWDSSSLCW